MTQIAATAIATRPTTPGVVPAKRRNHAAEPRVQTALRAQLLQYHFPHVAIVIAVDARYRGSVTTPEV